MSDINETQVIIAGKVLTLTGYETAEYTQKVANYINKKLDECKATASFRSQNKETQMLLVALNIADDYMKIHERNAEVESLIKDKDKEIYNLKHDIVTTQSRLDKADEQVRTLQDKMAESSKKLIQLDAKLRSKEKEAKSESKNPDEKKAEKSSSKRSASATASVDEKSASSVKAAEEKKNETAAKPAEDKKPEASVKPAEDKKNETAAKPAEDKKPEASVKPAEDKKPETSVKPAEDKKLEAAVKPAEDKKPEASVKPAEDKKPEAAAKPAEEDKSGSDEGSSDSKPTHFVYKQESLFKYDAPKPATEPRLVKDGDRKPDNRGPVPFPFNKK